jgi:hypothetical protein
MQWGYFEYGAYIGTPDEKERVLNDFILGRLDVGASKLSEVAHNISFLLPSSQLSHHSTPRDAPYRYSMTSLGPSSSSTRRIA